MFNLSFFEQWYPHIIGWPILIVILLTFLYLRVNWKVTTLLVPLSLVGLGWLMYDLEKTLGRPFFAEPIGKWMYVHHVVKDKGIDLLVVDKTGTRLYTIDNSQDNRNKLEQARRKTEQGYPQEGEFKKQKKQQGTQGETEMTIHDLPVPEILRKDQK